MAKPKKAPKPLEALNIQEAFRQKLKQKKDAPAELLELLEKKPNSNGNNYTKQKQKIIDYKPTNRKEKQIKTLAVYCLKIWQRRAEGKKIYFNPLLVEIANSPDIIKALEQTRPADFKQLKKAVINSSLRGKNKTTKQEILNDINGRQRLYRDYTDQKNSRTRKKEKLYTPTDKNKAERMKEQLKATAQQRPELVETFEWLKVGEKKAPELKAIRIYNLKKRAVRDAEQMREYIIKEHAKTGEFTRRGNTTGVYERLKARKQYGQRTREGELMNARQRARRITARPDYKDNRTEDQTRQRANKGELVENLIKEYTAGAIDRRINEQQKTARKGYTRKKKTTRPPLFDRNPIANGQLTRTATERHSAELLQQRQQQAINRAINNRSKKHSTEEERRERARRCKNNRFKARAIATISAKL